MRLIDLDAFEKRVQPMWDEDYGDILNEPTVEAIPVEWLESFKRLLVDDAQRVIDLVISQWNDDDGIIEEAQVYIDALFKKTDGGNR